MSGVPLAKAREELSDLVNRASFGKERIILSRQGKDVAAIVPLEALEILLAWEEMEDEADMKVIAARKNEPTAPWGDVKARLARKRKPA